MKKLILAALLLLNFSAVVYSQGKEETVDVTDSEIAENLVQPKFPGEHGAFQKYISYKIKSAITKPINLKVSFVVEVDGSLSSVKFLTYVREPLRGKITEAIINCPKWIPGSIDGKPVRVSYILPIVINITG